MVLYPVHLPRPSTPRSSALADRLRAVRHRTVGHELATMYARIDEDVAEL